MSTYWKNAVARANVFTGFAKLCVVVQSMKRLVKFGQVTVALITAPVIFSEYSNALQIRRGCGFNPEMRR